MNINVSLGKTGTVLLAGGVCTLIGAGILGLVKYNKKNDKACDEYRNGALAKYDINSVISKTLGNKDLEPGYGARLYDKVDDLLGTLRRSYSLSTLKDTDRELTSVMAILGSGDKHTVESYAEGIKLAEEREERDYERSVQAKREQDAQDLAMEKYKTDRAKVSTLANAVVKTVATAGNSKVELEKVKKLSEASNDESDK